MIRAIDPTTALCHTPSVINAPMNWLRIDNVRVARACAAMLACTLPLAPVSSPATPQASKRAGVALCIGMGEYHSRDKLRWAETDAVAMGAALDKNGYRVICLTREDATVAAVSAALSKDPALVYFAGHCVDSALQLRDGTLAIPEVARHTRFMFLDCCYAGEDLAGEGGTVVFAAGEGYAFEAGHHGLFTRHLLDWINRESPSRKEGLVRYVARRVARETGDWQRPVVGRL
jgi:hypothetical protein